MAWLNISFSTKIYSLRMLLLVLTLKNHSSFFDRHYANDMKASAGSRKNGEFSFIFFPLSSFFCCVHASRLFLSWFDMDIMVERERNSVVLGRKSSCAFHIFLLLFFFWRLYSKNGSFILKEAVHIYRLHDFPGELKKSQAAILTASCPGSEQTN